MNIQRCAEPVSVRVIIFALASFLFAGCAGKKETRNFPADQSFGSASGFGADVAFLSQFMDVIVLTDASGNSKIAVAPALQGRVMTSSASGDKGPGYGWINREAFLSGDTSDHMNAFGGEDRFWLGPEGGQFSIYFPAGADFTFDNWRVPKLIDLEPFDVTGRSDRHVGFTKQARLTNYSGTSFEIGITRNITLFDRGEALERLAVEIPEDVMIVAFESENVLTNRGDKPWRKESGVLSIWILGMFMPSDSTTVVIPHRSTATDVREVVNDNYFGEVAADRLKMKGNVIYFKGDGKSRTKIGLSPEHAGEWLGSYDAKIGLLTMVHYNKPEGAAEYVNAAWEIQDHPYRGDAVNAYNDGPPAPGLKAMGPFYELETSSPAAMLAPGESIMHLHQTFHLQGHPQDLDPIMRKFFGVTTASITEAFR